MYFGGVNGITSFYPSELVEREDNIISYVSQISTSSRLLARYITADEAPTYVVGYNDSRIEISLLGKGNKSPRSYHYQCLVDGLSSEWIDMKNTGTANFHLPPGRYTFYYEINNGFNPDAVPSAHFTILIQSPLYRRWWFMAALGLSVTGLALYLYLQHKKKQTLTLMYEYQLNEKLQKERMRISRELHDNIGAQMATVKRNINFLVSHFDNLPKEQVESKMRDLEGISTQINQELRDTIWATQNEHISVADFITRLKNYVFQTLGHESAYRVIYEEKCDKDVILGPFLALNLHRICQETLNNAFKHAGATELVVAFEGNSDFFKVTIQDNGAGFDVNSIHEGYGLGNIRHRSAQIGASIYFNRGISKGSSLEIVIEKLDQSNNPEEK
jgi:signal transduction histidine kinase